MNTKYTPGPWNLHKHYTGEPLAVDGGDTQESFIAWTYCVAKGEMVIGDIVGHSNGRRSKGWGRPNKRSEVEANARLIAAAPELLEALQVAMKSLATYGRHPLIEKQAYAAIAKATQP